MSNENNTLPPNTAFVLPVPILNFMHANFQVAFSEMQREAFEINQAHGFNEPDDLVNKLEEFLKSDDARYDGAQLLPLIPMFKQARTGLKLALIMREASEALEGVRAGNPPDSHIPEFSSEEAELADAVIRIMNLANSDGLRLAEAIVAKQEYNRTRPFKHGGKVF
jgi:NTP pyrophosphatase (non-canonical NTP hydrolase)